MKNENKVFVVNWAEYDGLGEVLTSGLFTDIYSTLEKAHTAVMQVIRDGVKTDMDGFDEKDWEDVYGTKDFDEIVKNFIVRETMEKTCIVVFNPNTNTEMQYGITCYDVNQVV